MSFMLTQLCGFGAGGRSGIADVSSLYLWLRADEGLYTDTALTTPVAAGGDSVAGWKDVSLQGRDWTQSTSGSRPTYQTNVVNGKPIVRFDGTDDHVSGPNVSALTAGEIFIVVKLDAEGVSVKDGLHHFGTNTNNNHFPFADGIIYDGFGTDTRKTVGDPTPLLTSWRLYNIVSVSGEWTAFLDGTQIFTTATNTVAFTSTPFLGKSGSGTPNFLDGDLAEVVLFSSKLGATDKATVKSELASRYNLTIA